MKKLAGPFALLLVAACASSGPEPPAQAGSAPPPAPGVAADAAPETAPSDGAAALAFRFLTGRFDSADQAARDPAYFGIQLESCVVEAPDLGERVLYVEQARMDALDQPYRQRLYVLEATEQGARSRVFELASPDSARGACSRRRAPTFAPSDVIEREGCAVEMVREGDRFVGHTPDAAWDGAKFAPKPGAPRCPSSLSGAAYATSEVTLDATGMTSWDRGFDAQGKQVWGARKGAYEFVRRTTLPE